MLSGRFDLAGVSTAYFAEAPDTALYEAIFRREVTMVSLSTLGQYELLGAQSVREIELGDLRPHAAAWPVLQSLRLSETQHLAAEIRGAGFAGVVYRSAQQHGQDCIVLFDPPSDLCKPLWRSPLINSSGAVNRWVMVATRGSRIPLAP